MNEIIIDVSFHPGEELAEKLGEMNLSARDFAKETQLSESYIYDVLSCKASITPKEAVAFEMVTKIPASLWLKMQHDYDDFILSQKRSAWVENFLKFAKPSRVAVL